jgi:hypothetical protein
VEINTADVNPLSDADTEAYTKLYWINAAMTGAASLGQSRELFPAFRVLWFDGLHHLKQVTLTSLKIV